MAIEQRLTNSDWAYYSRAEDIAADTTRPQPVRVAAIHKIQAEMARNGDASDDGFTMVAYTLRKLRNGEYDI